MKWKGDTLNLMEGSQSHINYFAQTDFRGKKTTFGVKSEDRAKHFYVIGKTGMGKSTMLENMAIQDIKNGEGMAFIDPHGKSAELLLDYVPKERIGDVVYFAPFDLEHPIAFNVMEDVGRDQRHLVANGLLSAFKKIWPDVWSSRMEYILNNTLLALLEYPEATLLGVNRMLSDKNYRKKVVENITDPSVRSFWIDEFAKYNERYMQEAGDAIKNKIGQFTSNPLIRNIIGQPRSNINFRQIMDEKKILIINLSKGRLGEDNAKLIGGMIITKAYLAAMSRANATDAELRRLPFFYFYVDEFQSFVNDSFADILSEARKYKLSLTIAHQYIEQMPENVRAAVFGNVGTLITFRVGPFDAEVLETVFFPTFTKQDLVNLGFAQIYLTLMIDGVGSQPFSAVTLPPIVSLGESFKDAIIDQSRLKYSTPRMEVEDKIIKWHTEEEVKQPEPPEPAKKPAPAKPEPSRHDPPRNRSGQDGSHHKHRSWPPGQERRKVVLDVPIERRREPPKRPIPPEPEVKPMSLGSLKDNSSKDTGKYKDELRSALQSILASRESIAPEPSQPEVKTPAVPQAESVPVTSKNEIPEETLRKMLDV